MVEVTTMMGSGKAGEVIGLARNWGCYHYLSVQNVSGEPSRVCR